MGCCALGSLPGVLVARDAAGALYGHPAL